VSVTTDLLASFGASADVFWATIKPYKEAIFGLSVVMGGAWACLWKGYKSQAGRPEEALSQAAAASPFANTKYLRLRKEDRDLVKDAMESVRDLNRTVRSLIGVVQDDIESRRRGGNGGGGGGTFGL
jgi:hypothetical protein